MYRALHLNEDWHLFNSSWCVSYAQHMHLYKPGWGTITFIPLKTKLNPGLLFWSPGAKCTRKCSSLFPHWLLKVSMAAATTTPADPAPKASPEPVPFDFQPPVIEGFDPSPRVKDETSKEKFLRKTKENPFVPIGELHKLEQCRAKLHKCRTFCLQWSNHRYQMLRFHLLLHCVYGVCKWSLSKGKIKDKVIVIEPNEQLVLTLSMTADFNYDKRSRTLTKPELKLRRVCSWEFDTVLVLNIVQMLCPWKKMLSWYKQPKSQSHSLFNSLIRDVQLCDWAATLYSWRWNSHTYSLGLSVNSLRTADSEARG